MPIRTHRGRAAVYRRLWGWPLRSPKHLAGALVVLAVVAMGVGFMLPEQQVAPPRSGTRFADTYQDGTPTTPTAPSTPTTAAPPTLSVPTEPPKPVPPDPRGLTVAEAWARAWTNHPAGITVDQWIARLRPLTTEEFLPEMRTVALVNVPTAVTGPPKPTESTARTMSVRLPTNGGALSLTLVNTPQGWRVSSYDKVA